MKPYYQNKLVTIYHGSAQDILPDLPQGTIVSDPPYNVGYHYDQFEDSMGEEEYYSFMASIFTGKSVIIHYPEAMFRMAFAMGMFPERTVAWVYPSNTPRQHRTVAWFGCKPDFRLDGQEYRNPKDKRIAALIAQGKKAKLYDWWQVNQVKNVSRQKTSHPCQIPEELMRRIIRITPSDLIIDPFAGSGTTLAAAQSIGVRSIGIEMSERYCEIMAKRCQDSLQIV